MERGLIMLVHAILISILLYIIMIYGFQQKSAMAEDRSIFIGAIILIYMVLFGHGLPGKINKNISG
jgi:TRAP-type C4-dicarboxylate transport system permease small subunit